MVPLLYNGTKLIVRLLLFLLTCWQVKGRENIPGQGPIIIVANHLSLADPPLLGASVNLRLVFMGKEELFHYRFLKYVVRGLGAIPMRRRQMLRKSLHQAEQILARGQALALFLREYRAERESPNWQLGQPLTPDSLVFANIEGKPIDPGVLSHAFSRMAARAGLGNVRFHDLRHTFASLMLLRGAKPKIISEALGHSSVAFTMDTYSHIIEGSNQMLWHYWTKC